MSIRRSNVILMALFLATIPGEASAFIDSLRTTNRVFSHSPGHDFRNPGVGFRKVNVQPVKIAPADSIRLKLWKKNEYRSRQYFGISFQVIQSTVVSQTNSFRVGFDYRSLGQPRHYNGLFQPFVNAPSVPIVLYTLGGEFGRRDGWYFGFAFGEASFQNALLQYTPREDQLTFSAKTGYNFRVLPNLRFRPSFELTYSVLSLWAENEIDNRNQDLTILDQTYPYKLVKKCGCTVYSPSTGVQYKESTWLSKLSAEFTYTFKSSIMLNAGVGYYTMLAGKQQINIQSRGARQAYDLPSSRIEVTSQDAVGRLFDYSGLSFNIGIAITVDPTLRKSKGSGTHHWGGGLTGGGHSCRHALGKKNKTRI